MTQALGETLRVGSVLLPQTAKCKYLHALASDGDECGDIDATYGHLLHGHDEAVLGKLAGCNMAADAEAAEA